MTREKAIELLEDVIGLVEDSQGNDYDTAFSMAIEALQFVEHFDLLKEFQSLQEVVRCKDCKHANECRKIVQYARNEQNTVSLGYLPIEWCSRGERREP